MPNVSRTRRLTGIAALATVTLLASCGSGDSTAGAAKDPVPTSEKDLAAINTVKVKSKLTVGVDNPHYIFSEDLVVANAKGYFKDVGIDEVDIKVLDEVVPPLIGGSLDLVQTDTDLIMAAAQKTNSGLRYLGVTFGGEFIGLAVRKGINSAGDLEGKQIAAGRANSRTDSNIRRLLTEHGVNVDKDVKLMNTGGTANDRLTALLSGTVDAATLQMRHRGFVEAQGGKFLWEETHQVPGVGWAAGKLLSESPDTVAAFMEAVLKARAFINDVNNKDEVLRLMRAAKYDIPAEYAAVYADENANDYHVLDAGFEVGNMDKFVADSVKFETAPQGTKWREIADLVPLWRAQKALGIPLRPALADVQ